jgi:hypothetical protein
MRYLGPLACEITFFLVLVSAVFYTEEALVEDGSAGSHRWRVKTLTSLDHMLGEAAPFSARAFCCEKEGSHTYQQQIPYLQEFSYRHGYFSLDRPLIGVVTEEASDIQLVENIFRYLIAERDLSFVQVAVGEMITKVLAYRNMQKGMRVQIPIFLQDHWKLLEYRVDEVLDLWNGMPAFCLLPSSMEGHPILLFRGTDFSLESKQSWASVLSDLDITGVGFSVFQKAKIDIHSWLIKAQMLTNQKTSVMGFSLGGILSIYTAIFEGDLIAVEGSLTFNSPGLPEALFTKWIESPHKIDFIHYVTQGDPVGKLGKMPLDSYVLFSNAFLDPIAAHTKLMCAESAFTCAKVCPD